MKVLFFFAGTGSEGDDQYRVIHENIYHFEKDVTRIFLKGCQHRNIGKSMINPDLDIGAGRIRQAFNKSEKTLDLAALIETLDDAIYKIDGQPENNVIEVEQIGLAGFSRGGISCLKAAQQLNDLDIPIDLFLNQPITGEADNNKPIFEEVSDLRNQQNLRSALILLGAYHNQMNILAQLYHSQMVPLLPTNCKKNIFLLPLIDHSSSSFIDLPHQHINIALAKQHYLKQSIWLHQQKRQLNLIGLYQKRLLNCYQRLIEFPAIFYTPTSLRQKIYGNTRAIKYDIYYQKAIVDIAQSLIGNSIALLFPQHFKQALALLFLHELDLLDEQWLHQIFNDKKQSRIISHFITEFNSLCHYLFFSAVKNQSQWQNEYYHQVQSDLSDFKYRIIAEVQKFIKQPTEAARQQFILRFHEAAKTLRESSLDREPEYTRIFLKLVVNLLSHVTLIGMLGNGYNFYKTGNWLFFEKNNNSLSFSCFRQEQDIFTDHLILLENQSESDSDAADEAEPLLAASSIPN